MNYLSYIRKVVLLILVFHIIFSSPNGFAKTINFEHLNRDNGLPANSVTCIAQDDKGFIWMGSLHGLIKYNGHGFKTFSYHYSDSTGIPGHLVTQIICADDGLIYLTQADNGFSILNPKTELFENFRLEDPITKIRGNITGMDIDSKGNLWLASEKGLLHFNTKTHELSKHNIHNTQVPIDTSNNYHNYLSAVTVDKFDNLYLLGYNSTLLYYNTENSSFTNIHYSNTNQESVFLFNAGHIRIFDNQLWISTEDNGLYVYDVQNKKTVDHLFPDIIISDIKKIKNKIWIATDGYGVYILNEKLHIESHIKSNPYDPFAISSNSVYSIYESRDNTIWIGCYATGVNLYNASRHKFNSLTEIGSPDKRLTNKSVLCVEPWKDSLLFIGTDGGGINQLNLKSGSIKLLPSENNELDNFVVKTICTDTDRSFYIGTYGRGLYHASINADNSVSIKQIQRKYMGKYKHVWWIHKASDTSIWIGYLHSGLSLYNPLKNTFTDLHEFNEHNIHTIRNINNEYWVSSEQKGISICNNKGEIIRKYVNDASNENSLSSNFVLEIFTDSHGRTWIGTNSAGLLLMKDAKTDYFVNINNTHGFPAKMVTNIEEDANGFLWISTNKGLVRYQPTTHASELFDNKDGLQGKKFNINSSYNYQNKTFYFGGVDGLSYFHPYQIERNLIPPQIAITGLIIGNKKVEIDSVINGRIIIDKPIEYMQKLNLSYKDEDFTIEFSALHFESSSKNQYKYKLEGFDDEWINAKPDQPSARYTNLRKGNFIFKVKAANADNIWNDIPLELAIHIKPPIYLTIWFSLLIVALIILGVSIYIRIHTYKLSASKKLLELQITERTKELENKANTVMEQNEEISQINQQISEYNKTRDKVFSIIAHDLKNPLNAIISFSNLLFNDFKNFNDDEKLKYIGIIRQTSTQMNGLIMNLLYWVNSQIGKIKPNPKELSIKKVFNEVESISEANSLQKHIKVMYEHNQAQVFADYEMLVTIIRNLVANSIKFTPENGKVLVDAFMNKNKTTISVSDTGIGMTKEQIKALNQSEALQSTMGTQNESGTGLGLFLCRDFTMKNNGYFAINSSKSGTTITITFPTKEA